MRPVEVSQAAAATQVGRIAGGRGEVTHAGGGIVECLSERVSAEYRSAASETTLDRELRGVVVGIAARLRLCDRSEAIVGSDIRRADQLRVVDIGSSKQLQSASADIRRGQQQTASHLALDAEVPLLHVVHASVLLDWAYRQRPAGNRLRGTR